MKQSTRLVSLTALLAALSVVLLYLASLLPSGRLASAAIAGLINAIAVIECGRLCAFACFSCTSILAAVLLPVKAVALIYILFFGYYPIVKSLAERIKSRTLEWAVKIIVFNAALTATYFLCVPVVAPGLELDIGLLVLLCVAGNICFVLYDMAFSMLARQYIERIYKKR